MPLSGRRPADFDWFIYRGRSYQAVPRVQFRPVDLDPTLDATGVNEQITLRYR